MADSRTICLVSSGLVKENLRLQPWRYLVEAARGLDRLDYRLTLVSDGSHAVRRESLAGLPLLRLPSVRSFPGRPNPALESILHEISPDLVLLSLGLTSFLHQDFRLWRGYTTIGIFTSPLYTLRQLLRLGLFRLWQERRLTAVHLLAALAPTWLLRRRMQNSGMQGLVVQTRTLKRQLLERGLWAGQVAVIPPGVDQAWSLVQPERAARLREALGYSSRDVVVGYFGSPVALRGLPVLIRAVERARLQNPNLKLLALCRRRDGELDQEAAGLQRLLSLNGRSDFVLVVDGFLSPEELARHVAACDLAALPFELVPSDAPLSLLETQALGKPLVTTRLACLPELAAGGVHYLSTPGDPGSLAAALLQAASVQAKPDPYPPAVPRSWATVGEDWKRLLESL